MINLIDVAPIYETSNNIYFAIEFAQHLHYILNVFAAQLQLEIISYRYQWQPVKENNMYGIGDGLFLVANYTYTNNGLTAAILLSLKVPEHRICIIFAAHLFTKLLATMFPNWTYL